ncbi:MAG: carboxypeptidase regulatory-like domain-containing protein [Methanobacterium sp.]
MKRSIFITISIIMIFLLCGTAAEAGQHNEAVNSDLSMITNSDQVYNSNSMILTNSGSNELSSQINSSPSNIPQNDLKNIIISGIVRNCLSGDLFQGVLITVNSISGDEITKTTTDSNGSYLLNFLSNETSFNVTASYPGHIPYSKEVTVTPSPTIPQDPNLYGTADFTLGTLNLTSGTFYYDIGIDSNTPPQNALVNQTLIQIFIKNNAATTATNVWAFFNWTSNNTNITLATNETPTKFLGDIAPGQTLQLFYLIEAQRNKAIAGQIRNFNISVWGDNTGTNNTITGNMTAETIQSQSRNTINSITPSTYTPHVGDIFTVTVSSNTSASNYNLVKLPLVSWNPSLVEVINYTVYYGTNGVTNNLTIQNPNANNFTSVWTLRALKPGNNTFNVIIHDDSGVSHHYNQDYGSITITNLTVLPSADIVVNKTYENLLRPGQSPIFGDLILYNITVSNYGPSNATYVNLTDLLPAGLTYLNHSITTNGGTTWTANDTTYNNNTGNWTIGNINYPSINQFILSITAQITGSNITINNTASAIGAEYDKNLTNNNASVILSIPSATNITTTKLVCNGTGSCKWVNYTENYKIGDTAVFLINTTNYGPEGASKINLQDLLPAGLTITNWWVKMPGSTWNASDTSFNNNTGNWTINYLGPNQTALLDIWVYINKTGNLTNCINGSCATIHVNQTADIQVSNSANITTVNQNDFVMFMLSAFNNGPDDAHYINIIDMLPTGLTYVSHTVDTGVYDSNTGIWTIDSLAYNKTASLNLTTKVTETGTITNWANKTEQTENDWNKTNDNANATIIAT